MSDGSDKDSSKGLNVDPATSRRMSQIRTEDTEPEMAVRRILHGYGFRYTTNNDDLPGSPDVANRSREWAVFVHGCFWHAHRDCKKGTQLPKRNTEFWREKLQGNRERDARVVEELEGKGYEVIVVWECELDSPERLAERLVNRLSPIYPS